MTVAFEKMKSRAALIRQRIDIYLHALLPLTLFFIVGCFLLMVAAVNLRVSEMKLALQNSDPQVRTDRSLALIARFKLNYEAIKTETYSLGYYLEEQKMLAIQAQHPDIEIFFSGGNGIMSYLGSRLIVLVNFLTGVTPPDITGHDIADKLTELAYFYERRRLYHISTQIYELTLESLEANHPQYPNILLHSGFCQGLMGDFNIAVDTLKRVEKLTTAPAETLKTAAKLRAYIETLVSRQPARKAGDEATFHLALRLYHNMQYFEALEAFNKLIQRGATQEYFFYRGRTFEEIGQADKAVSDYRQVIYKFHPNDFTKLANRRLFMLGTFYENNPVLREEAVKRAKLLNDEEFIRKSEFYENAMNREKILSDSDFVQLRHVLATVEKRTRISLKRGKLTQDMEDWTSRHVRDGSKILQNTDPELKIEGKLLPDLPAFLPRKPVKILTEDGNSFIGYISQESESHLKLVTEMGEIRLAKKNIVSRSAVKDK